MNSVIWISIILFFPSIIVSYFLSRCKKWHKILLLSVIFNIIFSLIYHGLSWYIQKYKERIKIGSVESVQETILVNVQTVKNKPIAIDTQYIGTVHREFSVIRAERTSKIKFIISANKNSAKANDLLVEYDITEIEINKNQVILELQYITNLLENTAELVKKGLSTTKELKDLKIRKEKAINQIKLFDQYLKTSKINAPFNCYFSRPFHSPGSTVLTGDKIMTLYNSDKALIIIKFDIKDSIKVNQKCIISYNDNYYEGEVINISPIADHQTNIVEAYISINDSNLIMGTLVDVIITNHATGVSLSDDAIIQDGPTSYVYIVQDGHAIKVPVQIIHRKDNEVTVEGLSDNQIVVISGVHKLTNFCSIKI